MPQPTTQDYDYTAEQAKAMRVIERYIDIDITDADSAYDILVDNDVHPDMAHAVAQDMYPLVYPSST